MNFNPYTVLNVATDASKDEIRKAYRTLAKRHHPDVGGARKDFEELALACEILMDDDRRAYFDRTGTIDQKAVGLEFEAIKRLNIGIKNAAEIARQKAAMRRPPCSAMEFDVLALAKNHLVDHIKQVQDQIAEFEKRLEFLNNLAGRFIKEDGEEDVIGKIFTDDIRNVVSGKQNCELEVKYTNAALELFEGYIFKKDDPTNSEAPQFFKNGVEAFNWAFNPRPGE